MAADLAVARRRDAGSAALDTLRRLAMAAEYRDDNTREHTERVGDLAARLARHLGHDDRTVSLVRQAAPLHDLGKIAIPDTVLLKPGPLTNEEFEVVKTHAVLGARVLAGGDSDLLATAERVARSHHERWDGSGYPDGLAGDAIPLEGRLVHVADVFDVLVHERPYKESWTVRRPPRRSAAARARSSTPRWCRRSRRSAPPRGSPSTREERPATPRRQARGRGVCRRRTGRGERAPPADHNLKARTDCRRSADWHLELRPKLVEVAHT